MKVFMCKRKGGYSGGLAVVAANTKEEAFKTFHSDKRFNWMNEPLGHEADESEEWYTHYYHLKDWFECPMLTANVDKPQVIEEDGYVE